MGYKQITPKRKIEGRKEKKLLSSMAIGFS
jgi:hypothetical protein